MKRKSGTHAVEGAPPVAALLDFSGRVALVTGAGGGIGAGIAQRFADAGAALAVHYRSCADGAAALAQAIAGAGGRAIAVAADLASAAGAERLLAAAVEAFGRVDVLVNNAGAYAGAPLLELSEAEWDAAFAANVRAAALCTQAAARRMIAQGEGGAIVNVASIEASNPGAGHSHYGAAKAALVAHTRAAAQELGEHGIRVNAVSPGLIGRDGIERAWPDGVARWRARAPLGRMGTPEDVADACLFLASPASRWITGVNLVVDGGVTARQWF